MKFLVIWKIEIGRLSGDVMKAVLRMRDHAVPLEEKGKVIGRYHIVGSHGGAWIYNVASNDELEDAAGPVAGLQLLPLPGVPAGGHDVAAGRTTPAE